MLTIRELKKSLGGRVLFEEADLQVNYGERVALVGPNGAGKSTLFNIILKREEPDAGGVERDEWTMIGYLPQEAEAVGDETALDVATGRAGEVPALEKRLHELEQTGDVSSPEYLEAHAKHEALSDPQVDAKAKRMLAGLGYRDENFNKPARELSGGWIMRAHLARLLVMEPDLLMLDEPTNHLDLISLLWLQNYLKNYSGAVLLISHDRQFMDEIVQTVYEIHERKLLSYTGNYADFLRQKEERYEQQSAAYKNQQKRIAELQEFADRFRSVASKAAQAQSKLKEIERMELIEKPLPPRKPFRFQIPQPPRSGALVMSLSGIHMAYGNNVVYKGLDLDIERGERTVLVGPNGAGKSTLLKILAGVLEFQKGERKAGLNAKIGYFSQHRAATLDPNKTVLQEVMDANGTLSENEARAILGSFLFRKDEIYKKTGVLSGGEKTRLNLIKFLVDPPNLLLMDEPTTHLDIHTVESLILALESYQGTLVFISHDVHFIRKLATKVLHVNAGAVRGYPGGYDYFLEKTNALGNERAALTAG
ncbi:ABC transporter-related protein [Chthoniobacter flavus Ellin428]|uniref:ABC transporter-related protein n=1 Tax=Chthoniobacter flavus Ellin428 TaxID=497964 RepID=B4D915_9BACT|nr:ABC-F family ATP-binding cassette domain-containing protein [Chthoniobacter flavus]EDY17060.1 ABC transporter-related protein [Chthoniobacter flavus Ellin428]TCO86174.1 ATP-binding cassette subfamily F protein 3 [Chthoniobacter flavus]